MRARFLLIGAVCCVASVASAGEALGTNYFWDYALEKCHQLSTKSQSLLSVCVKSLPVGNPSDKKRTFEIVVSDSSQLDKKTKEHVLVAKATVSTKEGEYVDYESSGLDDMSEHEAILFLPIVQGTPSDYQEGRAVIYQFSAKTKTLTEVWKSGPCGAGCRRQALTMSYKQGAVEKDVTVTQKADETKETELLWNGRKLLPKK